VVASRRCARSACWCPIYHGRDALAGLVHVSALGALVAVSLDSSVVRCHLNGSCDNRPITVSRREPWHPHRRHQSSGASTRQANSARSGSNTCPVTWRPRPSRRTKVVRSGRVKVALDTHPATDAPTTTTPSIVMSQFGVHSAYPHLTHASSGQVRALVTRTAGDGPWIPRFTAVQSTGEASACTLRPRHAYAVVPRHDLPGSAHDRPNNSPPDKTETPRAGSAPLPSLCPHFGGAGQRSGHDSRLLF